MYKEVELTKEEIKKLIGYKDPIIFDIGCYDGKDARALSRLFRSSLIFCFEADPRSIELFEKMNPDTDLLLIKSAVCNEDGFITLHQSDSETRRHKHNNKCWSASSSIRKAKSHLELFPEVEFKNQIKVPALKLDTWFQRLDQNLVDFMWVDINGAEEDFIKGAINTLENSTRYLYIEFSDKELYEDQITKDEILKLLSNFELIATYNFKGNFGNLLLKNKKFN